MRFAIATTLLLSALVKAQENPVTTTDVFVQSGEVSTSSAIIQGRCNEEKDSTVTLTYGPQGGSTSTINAGRAFAGGDWTVKVTLTDLEPNTTYGYSLTCRQVNEGSTTTSRTASFKTAPEADAEQDISFVWLADLAGQGWGRNPDLSITTVDGETITGGYVIFDVMRRMNPDFALFQGDMIYAGEYSKLLLIGSNKRSKETLAF
jgi:alkaline phosphatase D